MRIRGPFLGGKARPGLDADHWPHLVTRSKMSRSYICCTSCRQHGGSGIPLLVTYRIADSTPGNILKTNMTAVWNIAACNLVETDWRSRGALYSSGRWEPEISLETVFLVPFPLSSVPYLLVYICFLYFFLHLHITYLFFLFPSM
jgi:hypothetical protein